MGIKDLLMDMTGFSSKPDIAQARLTAFVIEALSEKNKRIRSEDALALISTIVAERCIDLAGDFSLRDHDLVPGARVFSDKVNSIIYGESLSKELDSFPSDSVVGMLRDQLTPGVYAQGDFPPMKKVLENYAAGIGKPEDWGKVPLSVPPDNNPFVIPLKIGYETRPKVDAILGPLKNKKEALRASVRSLVDLLEKIHEVMNPGVALLLTFEVINGMSKTAPMTEKAMKGVKEKM